MKKPFLLTFICIIFTINANMVFAQSQHISINARGLTVQQAINKLEQNSNYVFIIPDNAKSLLTKQTIDVDFKNQSIDSILTYIFAKLNLGYLVIGRQISIFLEKGEKGEKSVTTHLPEEEKDIEKYKISGIVIDEAEEPLIGVSVYLKDKQKGVVTDLNGGFELEVEIGDILVVTMIGYIPYEYLILGSKYNLRIKLEEAPNILDETMITGMGSSQRRVSIVGAITNIDVSEIQTPAISISNMLGGRVPGIITRRTSGEAGKNVAEFWIRGIGTYGANDKALVLIDGIEGRLDAIDPADIESFSILKDASATAVYGVRGANGVILLTTKRGTTDRLQISVRANWSISKLKRMPAYLDAYDYAILANEARAVRGDHPIYDESELYIIKHNLDPDIYPNTNWRKAILKDESFHQTYYLNLSGGGTIARYFASLGISDEDTAYKQDKASKYRASGYNAYNYRANIDFDLLRGTKLYLGVDGRYSNHTLPATEGETKELWTTQLKLTPLQIPLIYSNGLLPGRSGSMAEYSPYVMLNHAGQRKYEDYWNTLSLELKQDLSFLTNGLSIRGLGALTAESEYIERRFMMPDLFYATGRDHRTGELQMNKVKDKVSVEYSNWQKQKRRLFFEATADYQKIIGEDHRIGTLLYYYMSDDKYTIERETNSLNALPYRYQGLSGRITYGLKDTYFVDMNFGYTGSANFQKGKRFGTFPSVAAGLIPTNYSFMECLSPWLSFLKIRGSYGLVGNDKITNTRFPYLTKVEETKISAWGFLGEGINEIVGADNVKWEKAKKMNLGAEAKLFNNKLDITIDFFRDLRDGIFQQRTKIPIYVGLNNMPYGNVGRMVSWGTDGYLAYKYNIKDDIRLTIKGSFTYAVNEVKNWEKDFDKYPYQNWSGWQYQVQRGYIALGLFKDKNDIANSPFQDTGSKIMPGDIKYKDVNGDGIVNDDDRVPLAYSHLPRLMYGFGLEFIYKSFSLQALFRGTGRTDFFYTGNKMGVGYIPFVQGEFGNVLKIAHDPSLRWTPASYSGNPATENPNARFPRLSYGGNQNNEKYSTFWMGDARYLRLSELGITYSLKHNILTKIGINEIDFQLIGTDLWMWDKVGLWDPELARFAGEEYPIPSRLGLQLYIHF